MKYQDMGDFPEDVRIARIGETAEARPGKIIGFVTDADPGKADRYVSKLLTRFPSLEVVGRFKGPVKGTVTVQVRAKEKS